MIELYSPETKPSRTAALMADAMNDWLHSEYIASMQDGNKYLDNVHDGRRALTLDINDPDNLPMAKHASHANRQKVAWSEGLKLRPDDEFMIARQLFNITMGMSGTYKRMCYLKSADQASYLEAKLDDNSSGVNLKELVDARLRYHFGDEPTQTQLATPVIELEDLLERTNQTFEHVEEIFEFMSKRSQYDFDRDASESLASLEMCQGLWVEVAVDSILYAASQRDGHLSAVPFLEAKSISDDPAVIYPLSP